MNYLEWNDCIANRFFQPEMAGRPVHLFVTEELIEELGTETGDGLQDFILAIKSGPPWATRQGLCQKAHQSLENWRARRLVYAPHIAYLGLFVLAAGVEGDFAPHAYYPRLWSLLGEDRKDTPPSFHLMLNLWDDLERWSNEDKQGALGIFTIQIAGSWIHVGLPIAQTILTEHERRELPAIFMDAALDPAVLLSDRDFANILIRRGAGHLRPRTMALLGGGSNAETDLYEVLIETVKEELSNWDGTLTQIGPGQSLPSSRTYGGGLRLCGKIDRVSSKVQMSLRCRVSRDFPEEGLILKTKDSSVMFTCEEVSPGWSSPLSNRSSGEQVDAAEFDWAQGLEIQDNQFGGKFNLRGSPIRIFVDGSKEGLPGLVEVHQLTRSSPFYIAAKEECCAQIQNWAQTACLEFKELAVHEGFPESWHLFSAAEAISDEPIRKSYPMLSFPSFIRLSLRGGIRSSHGNSFFSFAAPDIVLEGGDGSEKVYCNDLELQPNSEDGAYELPESLALGSRLCIELRRGEDTVKRQTIYLVDDVGPYRQIPVAQIFDEFGKRTSSSGSELRGVAGTVLKGASSTGYHFRPYPSLFDSRKIFFIGQVPGQIVSWPGESLPDDWSPIWAIPMTRKGGRAFFCGTNVGSSSPESGSVCDRKKIDQWKGILWHKRKKIIPSERPSLRALWKKFQEAAERV